MKKRLLWKYALSNPCFLKCVQHLQGFHIMFSDCYLLVSNALFWTGVSELHMQMNFCLMLLLKYWLNIVKGIKIKKKNILTMW